MIRHPIAVVGMACRYPDATTPGELWQNVLAGRRAFRRIPECRLPASYCGGREDRDLAYATHAAVLRDWEFDRERFGVPGPLYRAADQTHWLALETAANALADAGHPGGDGLDRDAVGVVLGNSLAGEFSRASILRMRWPFIADAAATALEGAGVSRGVTGQVLSRLERLVKQPFPAPGDETLAGALANTIAGRICNHFDFHGTGYTVDGACASSLLAVLTACQSLSTGACDFMLAGGVDSSLDPLELVGFSRLGALAGTEMRVYDANPTGFLPGEGCGVVALMRAEDAEKLGLRAYAHIVGWASSSDGAGGLTRPARDGQILAVRRAHRMAGLHPQQVRLIEGHGTGTSVGDRVEMEALACVRDDATPAALGTIKAHIGHTKAAAGVAGLIKAALAVHHRVLPPTTGCEQPHDMLRDATSLRVLSDPEPWPGETSRAGVSSMGFGGINVHVLIEGDGAGGSTSSAVTRYWSARTGAHEIVLVGADSATTLAERLNVVAAVARQLSVAEVRDVAATAWRDGDGSRRFRAALVARTPDELTEAASGASGAAGDWEGDFRLDWRSGYALGSGVSSRIGLLFPGQAAPVYLDLPWWAEKLDVPSLPEAIIGCGGADTAIAQPVIVRQSLAGLAWLRDLGCVPIAATGHSLGEISALHWAGVLGAAETVELARVRGAIMAEYGVADTAMASLACSADRAAALLGDTSLVIAAYNAPQQIVVSGPVPEIKEVIERARQAGVRATVLRVSHGFHSPAMRPAEEPLRKALENLDLTVLERPVISTITGAQPTGEDLRKLLVEQLTAPVRYSEAVTALAARCDLLLEVGPGTILTEAVGANGISVPAVSMDCGGDLRRHAFATAVLAVCAEADLDPWFADRPFRPLRADASPRFLANPCENRSGWADAAALRIDAVVEEVVDTPEVLEESDPLSAFTHHLSRTLELPSSAITPSTALLADLHLNSLQVVQAVSEVATAMGRQPPSAPLSLADATVSDVADVLRGLPAEDEAVGPIAGVRGWVRHFVRCWRPFESCPAPAVTWSVDAPAGHWLHEVSEVDTRRIAVVLTGSFGAEQVARLLSRLAEVQPERLLIVHHGHPAAAGIGRSAAAELERCAVVVLRVPDESFRFDPGALADPKGSRYLELRANGDGTSDRAVSHAVRLGTGAPPYLRHGDVCLVTGGVRGITAHVAAELAERTGCTLVLAGRTLADDPDVVAALRDLREHVDAHYMRCDVTDPNAVRDLLAFALEHGEIRGLLHGAGINEPRMLRDVTLESFLRTMRPKVHGLRVLLDATGAGLRLVLGFGSVIGRQGLAGQAEYCIANDWLRADLEQWAVTHPACRTHALEWSVWSDIGMGVRLDVLDGLRRRGVEPIGPRQGLDALFALLDDQGAPVTVLLTSRLPDTPTITYDGATDVLLRFAETQHVHVPEVEAVVEAGLSLGADPYLDDHRIDGVPVLPAVMGLEAMAQAAALVGARAPWSMADAEFRSPITAECTVQVAALADGEGVDVVLRADADRYHTDRFAARISPVVEEPSVRGAAGPISATEPHPYYGSLLFHNGRFRRLIGYDVLSAFRVDAWIRADAGSRWFSEFHSPTLLLGDPAAHDATLHVLQACVPHRRALPVGVERFTVWHEPNGQMRVLAREITHTADDYTFDVDLVSPDGVVAARWDGLRLRAVGPIAWPDGMPWELFGPSLSRRLIESGLVDGVELLSTTGDRRAGTAAALAAQLEDCKAWHDAAGALHVAGRHVSASYADGRLLLALAGVPVGVDCERPAPALPGVLGAGDRQTAEQLADKVGEDLVMAAARVWSAREALVKLGREHSQLLRIDSVTEDGLAIARVGSVQVVTTAGPGLVAAIATGS